MSKIKKADRGIKTDNLYKRVMKGLLTHFCLSPRSELNRQPTVYDTVALPVELHGLRQERVSGVEPPFSAWEADVITVIQHPHGYKIIYLDD